jgi:uncharacterized membrane protein
MVALGFAVLIACVFGLMLAWEAPTGSAAQLRQTGLWRWLVSGNWPAKVGAGLLLLGVGALMRYSMLNIDVPAALKLASGIAAAVALGGASFALRATARHRALHVALAGAAMGVCYLTAYAAYGFFGYVTSVQALTLLVLVAAVAGVFAVTSQAMSVAVLALTGAFLAPAFALTDPGPLAVYGYYVAVSLLAAVMIRLRGWRALIHLSFLFTLAGALFFGWTRGFYQPQYYALMQPLLLALVAIQLAMPLLEARALRGRWLLRADRIHFVLLPLVAVALTLAIAPHADVEGALGAALLSVLWSAAGLFLLRRPGRAALAHFVVAGLLLVTAALLALADVPWLLIALGGAVALLKLTPRLGGDTDRTEGLTLLVAVLGALHVIDAVLAPMSSVLFLHGLFGERLIGAALILGAAWIARQRGGRHAVTVGVLGAGAMLLALAAELAKLDLPDLPYYALGAALAVQLGWAAWAMRHTARSWMVGTTGALVIGASLWAAQQPDAALTLPAIALTLAAAALAALATLRSPQAAAATRVGSLALIVLVALPWLGAVAHLNGNDGTAQALLFTVAIALSFAVGRRLPAHDANWHGGAVPLLASIATLVLLVLTTLHIERSAVAVATELAALAALWLAALPTAQAPSTARGMTSAAAFAALIGAVLIVQAMILRAFGPAHDPLTLIDLAAMQFKAMVSLMWAILGAALAGWASRRGSRSLWSVGAVLLVLAALKVVLVDFSGLAELGNIVAVIAAGLVFLGVAWLAPMPRADRDALHADEFARNDAEAATTAPRRG